jgi:hypothetical protein
VNSHNPESVDDGWRTLYRVGGILLIISGIGGQVAARMGRALYSPSYPNDAAAYLQLIWQKHVLANILWSFWIIGDFELMLAFVALYLVLRRDSRIMALAGLLFSMFYLFYDASVTELNSLTLVSLGQGYANATTDALKATYVAAAQYGYAALPFQTVLSFGVGAVGWLFWSVVMLKGRAFPRWMAVCGMLINAIGIIGAASPVVPGSYVLGVLLVLAAPLTGLWFIAIGVQLYRSG